MDFLHLKDAVAKQFSKMQKHQLFKVGFDAVEGEESHRDKIWSVYLGAFRPEDNPFYRKRTEHDCSCCRSFIRTVGDVVAIIDGKIVTIWDGPIKDEGSQIVASAMSAYIKSLDIKDAFLHYDAKAGVDKNFEQILEKIHTWNHFYITLDRQFVARKDTIPTILNDKRTSHDVFYRGLTEISKDSIDTVLELISQNSLYRGEEHKATLLQFSKLKDKFDKLKTAEEKSCFAWEEANKVGGSVARILNTSIGTLLSDLSKGKELEDSVKSFEAKVAPSNYKRPTALVTKSMIDKAKADIEALGLTSALRRRYATLQDISINNVLFANKETRQVLSGDIFDELAAAQPSKPKNFDRVEEITIDKFISDVLPTAKSLEVLFDNAHAGRLVSLIAPVDPTAKKLFKWDNNFSWSYVGDVTDSIKERVKQAGGSVEGDLCCRLAWFNYDDLDFHMKEPGGYEIYFGTRGHASPCGGRLDVDMNAGGGHTRTPVENIFYKTAQNMKDGVYELVVNNFSKRESKDVGFEVEIDIMGQIYTFAYEKAVPNRANVTVAKIKYSRRTGMFEIIESLPSTSRSKEFWNIKTNQFHQVNALLMSPNHWDDKGVGNRHFIFALDQCKNDGTARGFYNEFLSSELDKHRKVLEIVGAKMQTEESDNQLSGLGFSSTQKADLIVKVSGATQRLLKLKF